MPFVKLDTGILQSSLWFEKEQREIFLTALLMAMPRAFDEPIDQLYADRLEKTGWSAPPGFYGFVAAAGSGIIRLAMVDHEKGFIALQQLGDPDKDSRSNEYDGRRMIRMNGGYVILNYMKYREYDYTAAERMKRYRAKQKLQCNGVDVTPNERHSVTHAEAEAEAEAEKKSKSKNGAKAPTHKHSKPDSFEELKAYVVDKLNLEENDAAALWEHWKGNGFKNAGRPIVDWRMVASNWERRGFFFPSIQQPRFQK
jgi:hypothetical protein